MNETVTISRWKLVVHSWGSEKRHLKSNFSVRRWKKDDVSLLWQVFGNSQPSRTLQYFLLPSNKGSHSL